ncbi:MAG: RagB/SusD family nutrient uptake outer membrane protein [Bacteroidales bacterium]|nr:RagB/SusD family nutrient uptake outer membrane protein [Bacteroidales bacterium]
MIFKKNIYKLLALGIMGLPLFACDDLVDPAIENTKDLEQVKTESASVHGFLVDAYTSLPSYYDNSELATDDAVCNDFNNNFLKMATGSWSSEDDPMSRWAGSYAAIQYVNLFLENMEGQRYVKNDEVNALLQRRYEGEAYALRGIHLYYLLRAHAGKSGGSLLGVQLFDKYLDVNSNFDVTRSTFLDCVQKALSDLDKAAELLPMTYNDCTANEEIPEKFQSMVNDFNLYNRAMGNVARQLVDGLIVDTYRSKLTLLAASPAFNEGATWEDAANAAAKVIDFAGGIGGLAPNGVTYYADAAAFDAIKEGSNPQEIIWRENYANNRSQESDNFPPTLNGNGRINPTQNLVDAFPMLNGLPISDPNSGYDPANPYDNRDPRLELYIIHDGSKAGVSNSVINTKRDAGDDGIDAIPNRSTRTGYYMKKRLRMDVNCTAGSESDQRHITPRARFTEIFLNYAEAANEAWGPKGSGSHSYSAYDVIKAIRQRAGIDAADPYLEQCAGDQSKMRELIRNERRLELCFESFRFWDLRRWNVNLNETARGVEGDVEVRDYKDYMTYGPVPYSETMKFGNLKQNDGWQ